MGIGRKPPLVAFATEFRKIALNAHHPKRCPAQLVQRARRGGRITTGKGGNTCGFRTRQENT